MLISPLALAQNAINTATIAPPIGIADPSGGCNSALPPVCSGNNTATDSDAIVAPQLTLDKSHVGNFAVGVNGSYILSVSNTGSTPTSGTITIQDTLPAGLSFVSGVGTGWSCAAVAQLMTCTSATVINNGATGNPITLTVGVAAAAAPSVTNTARAGGGGDATCPVPPSVTPAPAARCSDSDPTTVSASADVSVSKTDGTTTYVPGTSTIYTIVVANAGPSAATNVVVVDNQPAGTTITGWTCAGAACAVASGSGSINQTIATLANGASVTYTVTLVIPSGFTTPVTNTATATPTSSDPTPGNNTASDTDTAVPTSDVAILKSLATPNPATPGLGVSWTIVATNNGPSDAVMTTADTVPAIVSGIAVGGANGASCTVAGQNVNCNFSSVPNGATRTYTISGTLSAVASGTLTNTATVSTTSTDNTPGNNTSTSNTPINAPANVAITKTGPASVVASTSFSYTLTLSNSGQSATGSNVIVQDQLPAGVIATAVSGAGCGALPSAAGALLTCTVPGPIAAGGNAVVTLTVTAPATAGTITNYAATNPTGAGTPGTLPGPGCAPAANTACASAPTTVTPAVPTFNFCAANTVFNITQNAGAGNFYQYTTGAASDVAVPGLSLTVAPNLNALMVDPVRNRLLFISYVGSSAQLWAYDAGNGGWYTAAPPLTAPDLPRAGMSPSGVGYLIAGNSATPAVYRVTAAGTYNYTIASIGTLSFDNAPSSTSSGDVAFDSAGNGWLTAGEDLYRIDFSQPVLVAVRQQRPLLNGNPSTIAWAGVAFATNGRLYFANNSSPSRYYELNLGTGTLTQAANTTANQARDLASCAFPVVGSPAQLRVTKTLSLVNGVAPAPGASVRPGDVLTYRIQFDHIGGALAATLFPGDVVETLPTNTTVVTTGNNFTCSGSNCPNTAAVNVPVGGTQALNFVVQINATLPPGTNQIANTVAVEDVDCAAAGNDCSETTAIGPIVAVVKTGPATVSVGQAYDYLLTLTNSGGTATGASLVVQDQLPAGVVATAVAGANCGPLPSAAGALLICTVPGPLAGNGGTATVTLSVTAPATEGAIVNFAAIATTGSGNPQTPPGPGCTSNITVSCSSAPTTVQAPQLTLVKSASGSPFSVGAGASYTLLASNNGAAATTAIATIVDNVPAGLAIDSVSAGCVIAGQTVTCTIPAGLAAGGSASFTIAITPSSVVAGTTVSNTATVTGGGDVGCPAAARCSSTVDTPVTGTASLTLDKTATVADTNGNTITGDAGDTITYAFSATNTGTVILALVTVADPLLPTLSCSIASLAPGATASCAASGNTYVITAADVTAGSRANTATATGDAPGTITDPTASDTETVPTAPTPVASLTLDKTAAVADTNGSTITGDAGDTITYSFSATNTGTVTLAPVTVTDPLLPTLSCTTASLAPGATAACAASNNTYVITAADVTAGSRVNTATATGDAPGTIPDPTASDTETATTAATPVASLSLDKTATVADTNGNTIPGDAGDTITYGFSATNTGTVTLAPVTVTDPLLPGLSCTIASLAPAATASCAATANTYVISAADVAAGSRANTATATGDAPGTITDPTATDTETVTTAATPVASLTLDKTATVADTNGNTISGDAGDTITYSFSATNRGTVTLAPVTVADPLLPTLSCSIASLAPGATAACAASNNTYVITPADVTAGSRANTATATGNAPGTITDPTATDTETVPTAATPIASLTLNKTAVVADSNGNTITGDAGDTITYSFSATNTGTITLAPVSVNDPLLPALACTIASLAPGATASCAASGNTYVITAADATAGSRANTATASGDAPGTIVDPTATDTETVPTVATPVASLTLDKTATVADTNGNTVTGDAGDTITYGFSATNTGTITLAPVSVTDPLLPGLACTIASLAPAATAACAASGNTYVITAADVTAGSRANTATATGDAPGTIVDPTATDTETVPTAATPVASLTLDKAATVADTNGNTVTGDAGDTITYSFSVTNTGTVTLAPVTVTDPLLPTLACSIASLAPGATASCAASNNTYVITAADVTAGSRANTATATGDAPGTITDPTATDTETVPTAATPVASLTLDKAATVADTNGNTVTGDAGDTITYGFSVTNTGTITLAPVTVTDPLLPTLTCSIASLAPGATESCAASNNTYVITPADVTAGSRANTATATGDAPGTITDPTASDTETVPTAPTPVASLTLDKTAAVADTNGNTITSDAGDTITYSFSATNTGTVTLAPVIVADPLLPTLSCSIASLAPGATASCAASGNTYVITTADVAAGSRANTATATGDAPGTIPDPTASDTETVTTAATPVASLTLDKTATFADTNGNTVTGDAGDTITYRFSATNTGTVTLAPVTVADPLLPGLNCSIASLAPAATATCVAANNTHVITAADVVAGNVVNTATASGDAPGTIPDPTASDTETTPTFATPVPSLATSKTMTGFTDADGNGAISLGDTLNYNITVSNTGNTTLANVTIDDSRITPSSITCASVLPGANCVLIGSYVITQADVDAGQVLNTALVTAQPPPGAPPLPPEACPTGSSDARCRPSVTVTIAQAPAIAATKTATLTTDTGTIGVGNAGDVVTYAVTVRNTGNITLVNLVVVDSFEGQAPATLSCTPTTLAPGAIATCNSYTHTITIAEANAGEPLDNVATATAQSAGTSQVTVSAAGAAVVGVESEPTLIRLSKTASPRDVKVGELVRYTLVIENTGTTNVVDGTLVDTPPAGFNYVDGSLSVADADGAGRLVGTYPIRVDQIDIPAGGRATLVYLLRVGAGVRPGVHVNSAYFQDGGVIVSNVASAQVQMIGDPLLDEALIVGTVFDDRDGDGWQDTASIGDVRVQGGFAAHAYVANSTTLDRGDGAQAQADASAPLLHGIALGTIAGRQSDADPATAHRVVIGQTLSALEFTDDFVLTTQQGVSVRMDAAGNTRVERSSGDAARGLTAAQPQVERRISQVANGYRVDYVISNAGVDERGIPGVRIASVEGLLIETDQFGRYHLVGVEGGAERGRNFILKVDAATVPPGSAFTTDNPQVRRVTPGLPVRFDFGVKLPPGLIEGGTQAIEIELGTVLFDPGSAALRERYLTVIDKMAEQVRAHGAGEVVIASNGESQALAYDRAKAVQAALLAKLSAQEAKAVTVSLRTDLEDPASTLLALGRMPDSKSPVLGTVLFDTDQVSIKAEFAPLLDKLAADIETMATADGDVVIGVVGHADRRGSDAYNVALGLRRAKAVYEAIATRLSPQARSKLRVEISDDPTAPVDMPSTGMQPKGRS